MEIARKAIGNKQSAESFLDATANQCTNRHSPLRTLVLSLVFAFLHLVLLESPCAVAQHKQQAIGIGAQLNYPHGGGFSFRYDKFQLLAGVSMHLGNTSSVLGGNLALRYNQPLLQRKRWAGYAFGQAGFGQIFVFASDPTKSSAAGPQAHMSAGIGAEWWLRGSKSQKGWVLSVDVGNTIHYWERATIRPGVGVGLHRFF